MQCDICGKILTGDSTTCSTCNPYAVDMDVISYAPTPLEEQTKVVSQPGPEGMDSTSSLNGPSPEKSALAPQRQNVKIVWIVGIVSLVMLVIGVGILSFLALRPVQQPPLTISSSLIKTGNQINGLGTTDKTNPYPPHKGTLIIDDPLRDNSMGNMWEAGSSSEVNGCYFRNNSFYMVMGGGQDFLGIYCLELNKEFTNFAFEVEVTILVGDYAGIIFREQSGEQNYDFVIGQNGVYALEQMEEGEYKVLKRGSSLAIHRGDEESNIIAVVANNDHLDLYVNQQLIASVVDSKYQSGHLGMIILSEEGGRVNALFKNARVWAWDN